MKITAMVFVLLCSFLLPVKIVIAQDVEAVVASNTENTHEGIYAEIKDQVNLVGKTITDDAYVLSNYSQVESVIKGDLINLASKTTINGVIEDDLRVIGGEVEVNGEVKGNVTIVGGKVRIGEKAIFNRNLNILASEVEVEGVVLGKAEIYALKTKVNSKLESDWKIYSEKLEFGPNFQPLANLTYYSPEEIKLASQSANIRYIKQSLNDIDWLENFNLRDFEQKFFYLLRVFKTVSFIFTLIIGYFLMKAMPGKFNNLSQIKRQKVGKILRIGGNILIIFLLITGIMMISIIGIPTVILLYSFLQLIYFMAKIVLSFLIGRWLLLKIGLRERRGFALLLGLSFDFMITFMPILGIFYQIMLYTFGLGFVYFKLKENK